MTKLTQKQLKENIIQGEDGFYVFWPTSNQGAYNAQNLKEIAAYLDKLNVRVQKRLNAFMSKKLK